MTSGRDAQSLGAKCCHCEVIIKKTPKTRSSTGSRIRLVLKPLKRTSPGVKVSMIKPRPIRHVHRNPPTHSHTPIQQNLPDRPPLHSGSLPIGLGLSQNQLRPSRILYFFVFTSPSINLLNEMLPNFAFCLPLKHINV